MVERIMDLLREEYDIQELNLSMNIKKDLGLTSFDFANLICILEAEFGIEIDEEQYRNIETVEDFVKYIESQV